MTFNILRSAKIDIDDVKTIRDRRGCGIEQAKREARSVSLYFTLSDMQNRIGDYEDKNAHEILNDLLEILMKSIEFD